MIIINLIHSPHRMVERIKNKLYRCTWFSRCVFVEGYFMTQEVFGDGTMMTWYQQLECAHTLAFFWSHFGSQSQHLCSLILGEKEGKTCVQSGIYRSVLLFLLIGDWGFLQWLCGEESTCSAGDAGLIAGLGRFPGGGHGNPLQYSCLENSMVIGAWWATVHSVAKCQTQLKQVGRHTHKVD